MCYQGVFLVIGVLETRLDNLYVDRIFYVKRNIDIWWSLQGLLAGILA